jgi:hypothetical protein
MQGECDGHDQGNCAARRRKAVAWTYSNETFRTICIVPFPRQWNDSAIPYDSRTLPRRSHRWMLLATRSRRASYDCTKRASSAQPRTHLSDRKLSVIQATRTDPSQTSMPAQHANASPRRIQMHRQNLIARETGTVGETRT